MLSNMLEIPEICLPVVENNCESLSYFHHSKETHCTITMVYGTRIGPYMRRRLAHSLLLILTALSFTEA